MDGGPAWEACSAAIPPHAAAARRKSSSKTSALHIIGLSSSRFVSALLKERPMRGRRVDTESCQRRAGQQTAGPQRRCASASAAMVRAFPTRLPFCCMQSRFSSHSLLLQGAEIARARGRWLALKPRESTRLLWFVASCSLWCSWLDHRPREETEQHDLTIKRWPQVETRKRNYGRRPR